MLSAVQSLLQSGEEAMGAGPLVRQVTTAASVLPTNPALHRIALGVIAGAYHFHITQVEQVCTYYNMCPGVRFRVPPPTVLHGTCACAAAW